MATCRFLCFCSHVHVWSILEEVGGGKMPCQIIVLIGNDYFNDKKYSGLIVLGDYVKRDQFEVIKPRNLPKIGVAKHTVGGSKLKLTWQPPQEVYRTLHPCMYGCFRFMCAAEYLCRHTGGAKYRMRWAAVAPIYD